MKKWPLIPAFVWLGIALSTAHAQGACAGSCMATGQNPGAPCNMGYGGGRGRGLQRPMSQQPLAASPAPILSDVEKTGMAYMREEEKLAHDVYVQLHQLWGKHTPVFDRIANSEVRHTNAMRRLLQLHQQPDPVEQMGLGQFKSPELQKLYHDLMAKGKRSLIEALRVGVLIEEADIRDLQKELAQTNNPSILHVYGNLLRGAQNHLRAFMQELRWQGGPYEGENNSR